MAYPLDCLVIISLKALKHSRKFFIDFDRRGSVSVMMSNSHKQPVYTCLPAHFVIGVGCIDGCLKEIYLH